VRQGLTDRNGTKVLAKTLLLARDDEIKDPAILELSCHDFVDNQVRLQLFALAYNLGNFLWRLVLPRPMKHWTMTTLREKLIKIGAKVVRHSKYVFFQMAEVAVPRKLFAAILERIQRLRTVASMAPS
jgi:hypothetical protein